MYFSISKFAKIYLINLKYKVIFVLKCGFNLRALFNIYSKIFYLKNVLRNDPTY